MVGGCHPSPRTVSTGRADFHDSPHVDVATGTLTYQAAPKHQPDGHFSATLNDSGSGRRPCNTHHAVITITVAKPSTCRPLHGGRPAGGQREQQRRTRFGMGDIRPRRAGAPALPYHVTEGPLQRLSRSRPSITKRKLDLYAAANMSGHIDLHGDAQNTAARPTAARIRQRRKNFTITVNSLTKPRPPHPHPPPPPPTNPPPRASNARTRRPVLSAGRQPCNNWEN